MAGLLSLALCALLIVALDPAPSFWLSDHPAWVAMLAASVVGAAVAVIAPVIRRDRRAAVVGLAFGAAAVAVTCIGGSSDALVAVMTHDGTTLSASAMPLVGGALFVEKATR